MQARRTIVFLPCFTFVCRDWALSFWLPCCSQLGGHPGSHITKAALCGIPLKSTSLNFCMLRHERGCPLARRVERTYKPKEGIVLGTMGSSLCILTSVMLGTFLSGWLLVPLTDLRVPAITHHVRSSTITKQTVAVCRLLTGLMLLLWPCWWSCLILLVVACDSWP